MISFHCPHCGKTLKVKDESAGKSGKCPQCGRTARAPGGGGKDQTAELDSDAVSSTKSPEGEAAGSVTLDLSFLSPAQQAGELGHLGSYRVLKVLGAGGMGLVFHAEDTQLKRPVALKVMLPGRAANAMGEQRFLREAQAAAAIEHDHIVTIYQVGKDHGVPFIAMQFLKGETLEDYLQRHQHLGLSEVLRISREIAEGLAAAHDRKLLHRDIKPSNVWLEAGKNRVKILDFGLTRPMEDNEALTQTGNVLGTPAYMAPEQAEGEALDARCDLFSLGCIMYRMCTGQLPFQGKTVVSILKAVALDNPRPPVELNAALPPAVSELILKLLAKVPERRPKSAHAVVELLKRLEQSCPHDWEPHRAGATPPPLPPPLPNEVLEPTFVAETDETEAVTTRPRHTETTEPKRRRAEPTERLPVEESPGLQRKKSMKKASPVLLTLLICGGVAAAAAAGVGIYFLARPDPSRPLVQGPPKNAGTTKVEVDKLPERKEGIGRPLEGHTDLIWSAVFSPQGKWVLSASRDRTVRLWNVENGQAIATFTGPTAEVTSARLSPNSMQVLAGSIDKTVRLWDRQSTKEIRKFILPSPVWSVAFTPDGAGFLAGCQDGTIRLWDIVSGQQSKQYVGHSKSVRCLAFGPGPDQFLSGAEDGLIYLWDMNKSQEIQRLVGHRGSIYGLAFSPSGKEALSGSADKTVRLWDLASGLETRKIGEHGKEVNSVAFAPDGRIGLTCGDDLTVRVWDLAKNHELMRCAGHIKLVFAGDIAPDGRFAVSGGFDGRLMLWDLTGVAPTATPKPYVAPRREIHRFDLHKGKVFGVAISPDGKLGLSAGADKSLILWDLDKGSKVQRLEGHTDEVNSVVFAPQGDKALSGSDDGDICLWDVKTATILHRLKADDLGVWSVALSADGTRALSGGKGGSFVLWDLDKGMEIHRFPKQPGDVYSVAIAPDGKTALSGGADGKCFFWDLERKVKVVTLQGLKGAVMSLAISSDGKRALTAGQDKNIRLWNLEEKTHILTWTGHTDTVYGLAFAHKSNYAISCSGDKTIRLWDLESGKELQRIDGHAATIWGVALSPDCQRAFTGSFDGTARLWALSRNR